MDNKIYIDVNTRKVTKERDCIGVLGENKQEKLVFILSENIEGNARLELERQEERYFIDLEKEENAYILEIKSSLLTLEGFIKMQLIISNRNEEVFKSKIFTVKVLEAINATETIPEQYATWLDNLNNKVEEINDKLTEVTKLKENIEKTENIVKEEIQDLEEKKENGYFKGESGRDGKDGIDGYTPVKGIDYYTEEEKEELKTEIVKEIETETVLVEIEQETKEYEASNVLDIRYEGAYLIKDKNYTTEENLIKFNFIVPKGACLEIIKRKENE